MVHQENGREKSGKRVEVNVMKEKSMNGIRRGEEKGSDGKGHERMIDVSVYVIMEVKETS